jgi:hypothetical protein
VKRHKLERIDLLFNKTIKESWIFTFAHEDAPSAQLYSLKNRFDTTSGNIDADIIG